MHFKSENPAKLLSVGADAKTSKGVKLGVKTAILYLAPSRQSGWQVCPAAVLANCEAPCLFRAGRGAMSNVEAARLRKTRFLFSDPGAFARILDRDIARHVRASDRDGAEPAVRLNGTSDIQWERHKHVAPILEQWAQRGVKFYDYTKLANRVVPEWYDLTFSYSAAPGFAPFVARAIAQGERIAAVFRTRDMVERAIANRETFLGLPVVDGDDTDVRYREPRGVVVALYAKGPAKRDNGGFVVDI